MEGVDHAAMNLFWLAAGLRERQLVGGPNLGRLSARQSGAARTGVDPERQFVGTTCLAEKRHSRLLEERAAASAGLA